MTANLRTRRHCERSEAIQLANHKAGLLRRFAPRNDAPSATMPFRRAEKPDACIVMRGLRDLSKRSSGRPNDARIGAKPFCPDVFRRGDRDDRVECAKEI